MEITCASVSASSQRAVGAKRKIKDEDAIAPQSTASSSQQSNKKARVATKKKPAMIIDLTQEDEEYDEKPKIVKPRAIPSTPKGQIGNRAASSQGSTPNLSTGGSASSAHSSPPSMSVQLLPRRAPVNTQRRVPTYQPQYRIIQGDFNEPDLDFYIDRDAELEECYAFAGMSPPGSSWRRPRVRLGRMGLLNGRYSMESNMASAIWPKKKSDLWLVFTISGSVLWGRFDLGGIRGVFRIEERPKYSSFKEFSFTWRGESDAKEGLAMTGDSHRGHVKFLGNGKIEGQFSHQFIDFTGHRLDGQGMRSEIDAWEMEAEWNKYAGAE